MGKNYKITDEELVSQICEAKDLVLFEVLYDRYKQAVFSKCYSFVHSKDEAKDLTQDVFLHVFIKLSTFKGTSCFSTWLYAVTSNFGINYLNRNRERKITANSKPIIEDYSLASEISDAGFNQARVDQLEIALTKIKPEERMLLKMKYIDNVSGKKIQEVLGLSESAVKMRILRAKAEIAKVYNTNELH
ncbi:RNA polymerase sigma factor [Flavobacterium sp. ACAM 123]|jgi:RNA polymerase sigma-70 factor (ECF subfamily)|uniref:RNA polymerase sigma factor n=1 Tax=Flavobacterium sp. ACAM 123 TaxID=1189620 RepID=UPI00031389F5|nr:RNA polymerase sigma factor [Flavobacterium sp. ACAM 123]